MDLGICARLSPSLPSHVTGANGPMAFVGAAREQRLNFSCIQLAMAARSPENKKRT